MVLTSRYRCEGLRRILGAMVDFGCGCQRCLGSMAPVSAHPGRNGPASLLAERTVRDVLRRVKKIALLLSRRRWIGGLRYGVAAAVEHRALPISRATTTVIDVGAHK